MQFMVLQNSCRILSRRLQAAGGRCLRPATRSLTLLTLAGLILLLSPLSGQAADDFIPPEQAFKAQVLATGEALTVEWTVAPGYYLYRKRIGFSTATAGVKLGTAVFPAGQPHEDEYFGRQQVYRGAGNRFTLPYTRAAGAADTLTLQLKLQGCADAGLCYPPLIWTQTVTLPAATSTAPTSLAALSALARSAKRGDDFLPPEQAFQVSAQAIAADRIRLSFAITPGYYLYQHRLKATLKGQGVHAGPAIWPAGEDHNDEYFGHQIIYRQGFSADLPVQRDPTAMQHRQPLQLQLQVGLQGCAEAGLCYPPQTRELSVLLPALGATPSAYAASGAVAANQPDTSPGAGPVSVARATARPEGMVSEQDRLAQLVAHGSLGLVLATFFGLGLLLAFTPCVLPMIPILSGIIAGQGARVTPLRGFLLSLSYVLGMALTYTIAGAVFAAAGQQAQAVFQQPWILGVFALLFVALALAMFGFYELQLPAALQTRLSSVSGKLSGGTFVSTAIMGALSSLVVTACVAPPLVAALAVISQTGDVVRGGLALFSLAIGMGAPLLVVGASAGQLLPRAGAWMESVKQVFGVMFLGVAVWMAARILPAPVVMLLWSGVALCTVWILWPRGGWRPFGVGKFCRGVLLAVSLGWAGLLLLSAGLGGTDPLRPLEGTRLGQRSLPALTFTRIHSVAELDRELTTARLAGKRVMVDFSADWCVSCKEMEKYTFRDAQVQAALAGYVRLQADVTANSTNDQALLQRFQLFGPPTTAFFGANAQEHTNFRLVGFVAAAPFITHLHRLEAVP